MNSHMNLHMNLHMNSYEQIHVGLRFCNFIFLD